MDNTTRDNTTRDTTTSDSARRVRWAGAAALVAAGAVGGGVLASTLTASATTDNAPTVNGHVAHGHPWPGWGGDRPGRSDEQSVSAADSATLRAAALKAVPGGTVYRIESDAGDAAYEAHMRKADGTLVTVKFDKLLTVTKVEAGMGAGDPTFSH